MSTRLALLTSFAAAAALALVPGCTSSTSTTVSPPGNPTGTTIDEGHARGTDLANQAFGELSNDDAVTLMSKTAAILGALNDGEINESSFAIQVVSDQDVFQFANDMIAMHQDGNAQLDEAVRLEGVSYIPNQAQAALTMEAQNNLAQLRATPPSNIDVTYIQIQVRQHAEAQVILDQLATLVPPGPLADYIANTHLMVNDHLDRATGIMNTFF